MQCRQEKNEEFCNCTYHDCDKKGLCCLCIQYHRDRDELPACYFPEQVENLYDRSIDTFIEIYEKRKSKAS